VGFLLHRLLADAAAASPDREAVRCLGRSLTYGELDASANAVARALIAGGVQPADRVAILLPKRVETIACVYGILKAGAAYVPLDPKGPARRAALVAADCTVKAVVTTSARAAELLAALAEQGHRPGMVLLVDKGTPRNATLPGFETVGYDDVVRSGGTDPEVAMIESDLAYILYTSGSTGTPKGVMLSHRNALTFVEWSAGRIGIRPDDRVSNHAPLHFDLSVFDLYLAALGRATLILVPEEEAYMAQSLSRLIEEERITVWYSVPSALMMLTRIGPDPTSLRSLRAVVFAGEVYPTAHLRELRALVPDVRLWNLYGPTETNVCTYYEVRDLPPDDRTIPIGRACENTEVFAINESGAVSGVGEEGELWVRGPTVMKGYWNRPERTAEVLGADPRPGGLGDPAYRTGDIVRLREDGDYDFLGRRDHQIKSRGYRIELGEIEAALNAHPAVLVGVAVAVPHEEWGSAVIAFVTARDGHVLDEKDLRRHVAGRLPRYMIPARMQVLEELPRTSNGKVDRQRLMQEARSTVAG
jgi:amino acid adenylation domain-containing protein